MIEKLIQTTYRCSEYTTFTTLGWILFISIGAVICIGLFIYLKRLGRGCP